MPNDSEILVILELRLQPGHLDAVVALYGRNGILDQPKTIAGYRGGELWTDPVQASLVVTSRWVDRAAYDQWLADPRRAAGGVEILDHLETSADPIKTTILERPRSR